MVKVQRLFAKTNLKVPVCRTYRTITQKCLQLELPTENSVENSVYSQENRNRAGNYAHLTSENGKLAFLTSGRPAFREHAKRTEGSDTTPASHAQKALSAGCTSRNFDRNEKRLRSPAGPRRLGTATRISASLFRRLSAFFESTSRPRPKSGKVRRSDTRPGDVRERAERSEGSDTTPVRNAPCFAV